jgi:hypothetical protein
MKNKGVSGLKWAEESLLQKNKSPQPHGHQYFEANFKLTFFFMTLRFSLTFLISFPLFMTREN